MKQTSNRPLGWTTLEEAQQLVEAGLPVDTADMHYWLAEEREYVYTGKCSDPNGIPCWSLGALIDLLPASIQTGKGIQNQYEIDIRKYYAGNELCLYQIAYGNNKGLSREWHDMINTAERENLIDAVLDMICWLLENDYIN